MPRLERNRDLEDAIVAQPDALEGYLVYGDWLQQRGDPRGALMVLGARRRELERQLGDGAAADPRSSALHAEERAIWEREGARVAGPIATLHRVAPAWELGCVARASLWLEGGDDTAALAGQLRQLFAHPAAFCLRGLHFTVQWPGEDGLHFQPIADVVAEHAPSSLAELRVGDIDELRDRFVIGNLLPLYGRHHANLRILALMGRASTVSAPHGLPNLRELSLAPVGLTRTWTRVVVAERWPALRVLRVEHVEDDDFAWLSRPDLAERFPSLRRLEVWSARTSAVVAALSQGGLHARLLHDRTITSCTAFVAPT
jgi:uncharacterized protein (TIGR02996 family)